MFVTRNRTLILLIFVALFLLALACGSEPGAQPKEATPPATEQSTEAAAKPSTTEQPTEAAKPVTEQPIEAAKPATEQPTEVSPTNTPVSPLSFTDIIQNAKEKGWTTTQYTNYLDTIKGQNVSGWSGKIIEIDKWAGENYISLDMKPGEPLVDAYVYIKEDDLLKVGLGQDVKFAGTIDSEWPEDNGFYALQIKGVTLLELGKIPLTPTPEPELATPTVELAEIDTQTAPASLGITQVSLKSVYEDLGFTFKDATPVRGQPRIMGESATTAVELIGPPDQLTQASIMFAASQDKNENATNVIYMLTLLKSVTPEWSNAVTWLTTALPEATKNGTAGTIHNNVSLEIIAVKELGIITFTAKGISATSAPSLSDTDPIVIASNNVNLRSGPGTNFDQVGSLQAGENLPLLARNADSSWWQVSTPTGPAWVAASVVTVQNLPDDLPIADAPAASAQHASPTAAPEPVSAPPTSAPAPATAEMGIEKTVGTWALKLYDVKRAKAVWFFGDGTYAQGVWFIPMVEFRNNSGGTRAPGDDLTFYFEDDKGQRFEFNTLVSDGVLGAAHQFTTGHYYDEIDPGLVLGISLPIDTPQDLGAVWLKVEEDPNFSIYLGKASEVPLVDK